MIHITKLEFRELATYVKKYYGLDLTDKRVLIETRLQTILAEKNFNSFSQYYHYIASDTTGKSMEQLVNKLTTNYTFFMRETQHFDYFKQRVLPCLMENSNGDLRIWSAGCSSGEEPYTLAMTIAEYLGFNINKNIDTKILATDISKEVLDIAKKGIYSDSELLNVPKIWRELYFSKYDDSNSIICDKIKDEVIFRNFNLMDRMFPFKRKFQVIFCRNVMIYFDNKTKEELINKFYDWTEPGGYLFIGHSESINFSNNRYKYIMPSIYRKE